MKNFSIISVSSASRKGECQRVLFSTPLADYILVESLQLAGPLAQHLGIARDKAMSATGKGSGNEVDLDSYDEHYSHVIALHPTTAEILGACRFLRGDAVLAARGVQGFYTSQSFHLESKIPRLAKALEVGRLFVRSRAEAGSRYRGIHGIYRGLWQGVKLAQEGLAPLRYLVGSLTLSNEFSMEQRQWLCHSYLNRYPCQEPTQSARAKLSPLLGKLPPSLENFIEPDMFRLTQAGYPASDLSYECVGINQIFANCWDIYTEARIFGTNNFWNRI